MERLVFPRVPDQATPDHSPNPHVRHTAHQDGLVKFYVGTGRWLWLGHNVDRRVQIP